MRLLKTVFLFILFGLISTNCQKEELLKEIPFYFYDFESDYRNLDSIFVSEFDNDNVLGPFNNSGFSVRLEELPPHDYIRLQFDLYIHDSWEGNSNESGNGLLDHDAWFIEFDPHEKVKPHEKIYFETTFSNGLCVPSFCYTQSYPNEFPFNNEARTGALSRSMNGRCLYQDSPVGTSLYEIDKIFPHSKTNGVLAFYDRLKQDLPFPALCEESWSMDNLSITLFKRD